MQKLQGVQKSGALTNGPSCRGAMCVVLFSHCVMDGNLQMEGIPNIMGFGFYEHRA